jgi:hypothetical protein
VRGVLAAGVGPWSPRRWGAWAVLSGLADLAEAAWRQRLRVRNDGRRGLLDEWVAAPAAPARPGPRPAGRRGLVAARPRRQPGGTGDDGRRPRADDLRAGRRPQGSVPERRGGAPWGRYQGQAAAVSGADRGAGARRRGARAVRPQAAGGGRRPPAPLPLDTAAGQPGPGRRWRRQRGAPAREWRGWWRWAGPREAVRRVAAQLAPPAPQRARRRAHRPAHKAGRTRTAPTRAVAGGRWRLTTLDADAWSTAAGLSG